MIVIEIKGGALCGVYTDVDSDIVLVDWDNIAVTEDGGAEYWPKESLQDMYEDTTDLVSVLTAED